MVTIPLSLLEAGEDPRSPPSNLHSENLVEVMEEKPTKVWEPLWRLEFWKFLTLMLIHTQLLGGVQLQFKFSYNC